VVAQWSVCWRRVPAVRSGLASRAAPLAGCKSNPVIDHHTPTSPDFASIFLIGGGSSPARHPVGWPSLFSATPCSAIFPAVGLRLEPREMPSSFSGEPASYFGEVLR